MSKKTKERRCKHCGKLLVDEKFYCRRCVLEGRNTAGKLSSIFGAIVGVAVLLNNNSNGYDSNDDNSDDV